MKNRSNGSPGHACRPWSREYWSRTKPRGLPLTALDHGDIQVNRKLVPIAALLAFIHRQTRQLPGAKTLRAGGVDVVIKAIADHQSFSGRNAKFPQAGEKRAKHVRIGFGEPVGERKEAKFRFED